MEGAEPPESVMLAPILETQKEQRQREKRRERQMELARLLRRTQIEWEQVHMFIGCEGLNPNYVDSVTRISTCMQASWAGETDMVRWCIRTRADVNARSAVGRAALHMACGNNQAGVVRLLLEAVADPNLRTLSMTTPLHFCCQNRSFEAAAVLLQEARMAIDVDAMDSHQKTPEELSRDKFLIKLIRKYRSSLSERRKTELKELCLKRIFNLVDFSGDGLLQLEEWMEFQHVIASHFQHCFEDEGEEAFHKADRNCDGSIDYTEFQSAYLDLLGALALPFRNIMDSLADVEQTVLEARIELETDAGFLGRMKEMVAREEKREAEAAREKAKRSQKVSTAKLQSMKSIRNACMFSSSFSPMKSTKSKTFDRDFGMHPMSPSHAEHSESFDLGRQSRHILASLEDPPSLELDASYPLPGQSLRSSPESSPTSRGDESTSLVMPLFCDSDVSPATSLFLSDNSLPLSLLPLQGIGTTMFDVPRVQTANPLSRRPRSRLQSIPRLDPLQGSNLRPGSHRSTLQDFKEAKNLTRVHSAKEPWRIPPTSTSKGRFRSSSPPQGL